MTLGWDNPTADRTTTILPRHGDTRLSPEHRFSGQRDLPLSASGTRQARAAAAWRREPGQAPPGGENFADTARRVNRACDRLLRDHGGKTVQVVSHVTPDKDPAVPGSRRPA